MHIFIGTLYAHIVSLKKPLQPTWNKLQLDPKPTLKKNFEPTLETPWIKPKLKELHSQPPGKP